MASKTDKQAVFSRRNSSAVEILPNHRDRSQRRLFDLLKKCRIICLSQKRPKRVGRDYSLDSKMLSTPSVCLAEVMLMEGRRKHLNSFVVLMFIHLKTGKTLEGEQKQPTTTPRRVLLDTGADFNLISHGAHAELNLRKEPYQGRVHSIGGYTDLNSTVFLQWHFQSHDAEFTQSPPTHCASFYVLPPESDAKFDCILGRRWIEDNWTEFIALIELNRRRDETESRGQEE